MGDKKDCWTDSCKNKDPFASESAQHPLVFYRLDKTDAFGKLTEVRAL